LHCFAGVSNENGKFTTKTRRIRKKGVSIKKVTTSV